GDKLLLACPDGFVWEFHGPGSENAGEFSRLIAPGGDTTEASYEKHLLKQVTRSVFWAGKTATDAFDYEYLPSGENEGLLKSVTLRRQVNPWSGIRRNLYTYYGSGDLNGSLGDLKTATLQTLVGTEWV